MNKTVRLIKFSSISFLFFTLFRLVTQIYNLGLVIKHESSSLLIFYSCFGIAITLCIIFLFVMIVRLTASFQNESEEKTMIIYYDKLIKYFCYYMIVFSVGMLVSSYPWLTRFVIKTLYY